MFDNHPPFQIDGNFGGCAAIFEMLLQSHTSEGIHLLPALPNAWRAGSVGGLRARGGFEVNLCWADGKLVEAGILSLAGKECSVRYADKTARFETKPGHIYTLNGDLKLK
ncbi:MAG: hypothetical protein J6T79_06060 [Verrucomicrobia bacterium]|nr:hypothetical protein [Verrucomicrobiota bacterium]